jgi:hypothetical protein
VVAPPPTPLRLIPTAMPSRARSAMHPSNLPTVSTFYFSNLPIHMYLGLCPLPSFVKNLLSFSNLPCFHSLLALKIFSMSLSGVPVLLSSKLRAVRRDGKELNGLKASDDERRHTATARVHVHMLAMSMVSIDATTPYAKLWML